MKRERLRPSVSPSPWSVGRMVGGCRASGREQTSSALSLSLFGTRLKGNNSFVRLSPMWLLLLLPLLFLETAFPLLHCCQFSLPRPCARGREGRRQRNFRLSKQLTKCSGEGRSAVGRTDGREPNFFSQLSLPFSPLPFLPPLPPRRHKGKEGRINREANGGEARMIRSICRGGERGARKRSSGCCCCSRCRCMRPLLLLQPPPPWGLMR